jgi:hypothetical protein
MPGATPVLDAGAATPPFARRLAAAGSELGRQIERWSRHSLRRYLASLVPSSDAAPNAHRLRLAAALEHYLEARGDRRAERAATALLARPVIQQADHSNLLLDGETFLNNFLFHLACREAGATVALHSQCSTVSCLWKRGPVAGPVFLHTRGAILSVFPLSRRAFKTTTFCCLPQLPLSFGHLAGEPLDPAADPVLGPLLGRMLGDAPRGFRRCNEEIWRQLDLDHGIERIAVDESLVSECAARHLEDPGSPVFRLLFEPAVRDRFRAVKRELVGAADNFAVNHASPDFLWLRDGSRLRKVVFCGAGEGAVPVTASDRRPLPFPFTPREVAAGLRAGRLYCDRLLAYTVRCLLPGVVAVGGTSQQDYVALYSRALLETHRQTPFLEATDAIRVGSPGLSRLGGMALLELDPGAAALLARLGPGLRLGQLEEAHLDRPLGETIGSLACAGYLEPKLARAEGRA